MGYLVQMSFVTALVSNILLGLSGARGHTFYRPANSPGCQISIAPGDMICFKHIESVLRRHKLSLKAEHRSVCSFFHVSGPKQVVRDILEREAPHSEIEYDIDGHGGIPPAKRLWINVSQTTLSQPGSSRRLPNTVAIRFRYLRATNSTFKSGGYVALRYLDLGIWRTGYLLKECHSQGGLIEQVEHQLLAGESTPYSETFTPRQG